VGLIDYIYIDQAMYITYIHTGVQRSGPDLPIGSEGRQGQSSRTGGQAAGRAEAAGQRERRK
jgi:hypothetical protein